MPWLSYKTPVIPERNIMSFGASVPNSLISDNINATDGKWIILIIALQVHILLGNPETLHTLGSHLTLTIHPNTNTPPRGAGTTWWHWSHSRTVCAATTRQLLTNNPRDVTQGLTCPLRLKVPQVVTWCCHEGVWFSTRTLYCGHDQRHPLHLSGGFHVVADQFQVVKAPLKWWIHECRNS